MSKNKNTYSVYCIMDVDDNILYIGMSINFERRKKEHLYNIKNPKTKLYRHLASFDEVFIEEIIRNLTKKEAQLYECYLILKLHFSGSELFQSLPKTILYHK